MTAMRQAWVSVAAALGLAGMAGACAAFSLVASPASPVQLQPALLALACLAAAGLLGARAILVVRATLRAVQRDAARSRATLDGAGEPIMVIDDRATILSFNRAAERMFGYPAAEMIGTSLERLMTDGGRRAHAAYLAQHGVTAMVEAARLRVVHRGVRRSGEVFPFELTMTEWQDEGRRVFTGVMRDVTDHERAADALRESHARFVGVFDNSAHPMFIFAISGAGEFVLETMNGAGETLTRVSRYAAAGRTPEQLDGVEARELKRALLDCLATAAPVSTAITVSDRGARFRVPAIFTPMRNASGEIRAVLATAQPSAAVAVPPLRSVPVDQPPPPAVQRRTGT